MIKLCCSIFIIGFSVTVEERDEVIGKRNRQRDDFEDADVVRKVEFDREEAGKALRQMFREQGIVLTNAELSLFLMAMDNGEERKKDATL